MLGLGNPILTDDGVGIHVVRTAAAQCSPENGVTFAEASVGGLRLLDILVGYDRVVMVDAIRTHGGRPGEVYRLDPGAVRGSLHSGSSHDVSLCDALHLGRSLGMTLPDDEAITILAVEVEDVLTFGETCTAAVEAAIPQVVPMVLEELQPRRPAHRNEGAEQNRRRSGQARNHGT